MTDRVAIFDWDNTVVRGFANDYLFSLLIKEKTITDDLLIGRGVNHASYARGELSHDRMVELNRILLEENFRGVKKASVLNALSKYHKSRMQFAYEFMFESIFPYLSDRGIRIIVVTGALKEIIELYKSDFNLWRLIALEATVENGVCTGEFSSYIATSDGKERVINELIAENDLSVEFSFGDSTSYIPLFSVANYAFVNNSTRFFERENIEYLDFNDKTACETILSKLKNEL